MGLRLCWLVSISVLGCAVDNRTPSVGSAAGGSTSSEREVDRVSPANLPDPVADNRGAGGTGSVAMANPEAAGAQPPLAEASPVTLSLVVRGDGSGSVSVLRDNQPAQLCLGDCSVQVSSGSVLQLTAAPGLNTAVRWSIAGCVGETPCQVRLDSDLTVEATLELAYNVAFVTRQSYTVATLPRPGEAANQECARVAAEAGLHGSRFVAWLASPGPTADAADDILPSRSFQHRGGWVRPDGQAVARSLAGLTRGELLHPIQLDETGAVQPQVTASWTAASTAGTLSPESTPGAASCRDWTSSNPADLGGIALSNTLYLGSGYAAPCDRSNMLLCFGDDSDAELPAAPITGRLAFRSAAFFVPSTGLAAADAICQREACAASLSGGSACSERVFKAYLHSTSQAAWQRFDLTGPNWQRPDGVAWLPDAANLAADAKDRLTGLTVHADGSYVLQGVAWVGNQTGANCRDWSSASAEDRSATTGPDIIDPRGLGAANSTDCSYASGTVLCLED